MRVRSITAYGVLGEYDHSIEFRGEDELVIIYGPNGVGKTKFLEIIDTLFAFRISTLARLPFLSAEVLFVDGTVLRATRRDGQSHDADDTSTTRLAIELQIPGEQSLTWMWSGDRDRAQFEKFVRNEMGWIQIDDSHWQDPADGEILDVAELQQRYEFPGRKRGSTKVDSPLPEGFTRFSSSIRAHLIETQRLQPLQRRRPSIRYSAREQTLSSTISRYAEEMQQKLSEALAENSRISQQLDRTFPSRVLTRAQALDADEDAIRTKYEQQNKLRSRLAQIALIGLEPELSLPERRLSPFETSMLALYLQDADQKLRSFEALLARIELLEDILNSRLLGKSLHVDATNGLAVRRDSDLTSIALDTLSSGEQHEIILMYGLLFNVSEDSLVMIDEPEISLHVSWQINFISDVVRISRLAKFQFLVATHSPQIINEWWTSSYQLGPVGAEL